MDVFVFRASNYDPEEEVTIGFRTLDGFGRGLTSEQMDAELTEQGRMFGRFLAAQTTGNFYRAVMDELPRADADLDSFENLADFVGAPIPVESVNGMAQQLAS